jgi:hypothetical protein
MVPSNHPLSTCPVGACALAPSAHFALGHRRIGYDASSYRIDSLKNSVSDILFLLLGWLVSQVAHMLVPEPVAFWVLMGVAAALFLAFLYLFTEERAQWKRSAEGADDARAGCTCLATDTALPRIVGSSAGGAGSSRWPGTAASRVAPATGVAPPRVVAAGPRPRVQFVL